MKKIMKAAELLWLLGVVFVALGVSVCSKANLGVSMIAAPAFVFQEALYNTFPWLTVGIAEYLFQGVLLLVMCLAVRRFNWRYLLAFASAVIYGYTLDLFLFLLPDIPADAVALRWTALILGDVFTAFGVACFFRTYMPLQVYELFVAEVAARYNLNINRVKSVFDITLFIFSVASAFLLFMDADSFDWSQIYRLSFHSIGLGTVVTTLINSPIIVFFGKQLDKIFEPSARFPKMEKVLKRE